MEYIMLNNTKEQVIDKHANASELGQVTEEFSSMYGETFPINSSMTQSMFYYKPNETQKIFFDLYQSFVDDSKNPCDAKERVGDVEKRSFPSVVFEENAVGKILKDIIAVSLESVFDKACQEDFSVVQTQIALACQSYKIDVGSYPASLDLLYPSYLSQNYKLFNSKNINYDMKTGIASLAQ